MVNNAIGIQSACKSTHFCAYIMPFRAFISFVYETGSYQPHTYPVPQRRFEPGSALLRYGVSGANPGPSCEGTKECVHEDQNINYFTAFDNSASGFVKIIERVRNCVGARKNNWNFIGNIFGS